MKVIILGISGMIGHRVWLECTKNIKLTTIGIMRKKLNSEPSLAFMSAHKIYDEVDVENFDQLKEILDAEKPDWIVNAIGITIRKKEIENIDYALQINSFLPKRLEKWGQQQPNSTKIIHFSTDCVFSGSEGGYNESSNPTAKDTYGKTKFLGEINDSNSITLRFSCIGRELFARTELLEWFLAQKNNTIKGFTKAMYSGVTTRVISEEVCKIITQYPYLTGLYQLSSNPISKYDLLNLVKQYFNIPVEIIATESYVSDKTLSCQKYSKATGFIPPKWPELMAILAQDNSHLYK